jgi:23S rRNA (guanine745-N1)-methyltransferase
VAPLPPRPGHRLLRCPICRLGLDACGGALACRNGHSFDFAHQGYVNLLPGNRPRPAAGGDGSEQLRHRSAFLEAGHFDFITAEIAERLRHAKITSMSGRRHVLDAGCGAGHYLARIAAALGPRTTGLGLDISAAATRLVACRWSGLAFAVTDLWSDWPVRDASIDLVLNVFAPRNFADVARVLRPAGWLALVYPEANHLIELRRRHRLLDQHGEKARRYREAASRTIGPAAVTRIVCRTILTPDAERDIVQMGPNARHPARSLLPEAEPIAVTFNIAVLLARKRPAPKAQNFCAGAKADGVSRHLDGARNRRWISNRSSTAPNPATSKPLWS